MNDLSRSFQALQEKYTSFLNHKYDKDLLLWVKEYEYTMNITTADMHNKIDLLVFRINQQIQSLEIAERRQAMLSGLGAIASIFMPWTWFSGSIMKSTAEAVIHGSIASELSGTECEDVPLLNFLTEFAARFCVLGTEVSLLRTIDDFKNFDRKTLKEYFQSDELR